MELKILTRSNEVAGAYFKLKLLAVEGIVKFDDVNFLPENSLKVLIELGLVNFVDNQYVLTFVKKASDLKKKRKDAGKKGGNPILVNHLVKHLVNQNVQNIDYQYAAKNKEINLVNHLDNHLVKQNLQPIDNQNIAPEKKPEKEILPIYIYNNYNYNNYLINNINNNNLVNIINNYINNNIIYAKLKKNEKEFLANLLLNDFPEEKSFLYMKQKKKNGGSLTLRTSNGFVKECNLCLDAFNNSLEAILDYLLEHKANWVGFESKWLKNDLNRKNENHPKGIW